MSGTDGSVKQAQSKVESLNLPTLICHVRNESEFSQVYN